MTILRSNLYRLLFRDSIFKYSLRLMAVATREPVTLDPNETAELEDFLLEVEMLALTDLNYLYLPY